MLQAFDENALLFIQEQIRNGFLTPIMKVFTYMGDAGILWVVLGVALLLFAPIRRRGAVYLLALGAAAFLNNLVLKPLIARPRPYEAMAGLEVLIVKLGSYSFPSGHASSSFAAATALTLLFGRRAAWSFVPAAIIALSRPYLGMHYLTDVFFGAILGVFCAWAIVKAVQKHTEFLSK